MYLYKTMRRNIISFLWLLSPPRGIIHKLGVLLEIMMIPLTSSNLAVFNKITLIITMIGGYLLLPSVPTTTAAAVIPGCADLAEAVKKIERNETNLPPCLCDNATADANSDISINCAINPRFPDLTVALEKVKKAGRRVGQVNLEYMTFNDTVGIPDDYFKQFGFAPTAITIVSCQNDNVPMNYTFAGLADRLKNLTIIGCNVLSMPRSIANLTSLERLILKDTYISSIFKDDFRGLNSLRHLDLTGNQLNYVERGAFDHLSKLETAILGPRNALNTSSFGELNKLISAKTLILSNNGIERLPDHGLSALGNLETLDLSTNFIENITAGAFAGLTNLTKLSLTQNLLDYIEDGSFVNQSKLLRLDAEANYMQQIWPETFEGLNSLEELNLDDNNFFILDRGTFSTMPRLKSLSLRRNQDLQYVDPDVFGGLRNVQVLNFSLSNITDIPPQLLQPIGLKLQVLDLNGSNIEKLDDEAFHFGAQIRNLSLAYTQLTTLPKDVFIYLTHLRYLDLSNVHWVCDDKLAWLVGWLKTAINQSNITLLNPQQTACWQPLELRNSPLTTLDPSSLRPYEAPSEIEQPPTTTSTIASTTTTNSSNPSDTGLLSAVNATAGPQTTVQISGSDLGGGDPLMKSQPSTSGDDDSKRVKIIIAIVASVISAATIAIIVVVVLITRKHRRKQREQEENQQQQQAQQNGRPPHPPPSSEETEMTITQINGTGGTTPMKNGTLSNPQAAEHSAENPSPPPPPLQGSSSKRSHDENQPNANAAESSGVSQV